MHSLYTYCAYFTCVYSFSKVILLEDGEGKIHMKNLSMHPATNEEEGKYLTYVDGTIVITLDVYIQLLIGCLLAIRIE